jgi:hypothetical protein
MSFKLFLCRLGLHKWFYYKRKVNHNDSDYFKDTTHTVECRRCVKCERIEESVFGYTWQGKFRSL